MEGGAKGVAYEAGALVYHLADIFRGYYHRGFGVREGAFSFLSPRNEAFGGHDRRDANRKTTDAECFFAYLGAAVADPAAGDSVAEILENMGLERCGTHGTTAALALLNDAVKKGGVMASGHVGGLSGAFIPVSEDRGMIDAVKAGTLSLQKLEAMTAVCSVGLDMIAVPGDATAETIAGIIADEISIGVVNNKTTAVRLIPVAGKGVGEVANFGGLLGYAPIMPLKGESCAAFVSRGGRIPAPIHSLRN